MGRLWLLLGVLAASAPAAITITATLPNGTAGTPYAGSVSASGGTAPYTWSGSAPDGLTVGPTGAIGGTPVSPGILSFDVTVMDATTPMAASATKTLSVTINSAPLSITTATLPIGSVGASYMASLSAMGGIGSYTWSGSAPAGLSLSATGVISGTPNASGTFSFPVTVTDSATPTAGTATKTLSLAINAAPVSITTTTLPSATVGSNYSASLSASGGVSPYTWSGTAPAGLTLSSAGTISGTPSASGTFSFPVIVTDSATPIAGTATKTLSLTINAAPVSITTTSLPSGTVGTNYSASLSAGGGVSPYMWSGTAPAGLTLSSAGAISGTPNASGMFSFPVTVTDSATPTAGTATKTLSLTINGTPVSITTTSLPNGTVGSNYSASLSAGGGVSPYTWSGTAPAGLTLSSAGTISGTPNASGTFSFPVTVTDSATPTAGTATKTLSLTINGTPVSITTTSLPNGTVGSNYSASLSAGGGVSPYTWSGTAPAGLTLSSAGTISGTPNASGTFSFPVTVTDSATPIAGTATKTLSLTINAAPVSITTTSLPTGTVGTNYSASLSASGGVLPYMWSGTAPAGLTLSSAGTISGTPNASGTFSFPVTVTDSATPTAGTATKTLSLTINAAPVSITTTSLLNGTVGTGYSQSLAATGGTGMYTWSVATGSLPAGLMLNGNQITGNPTTAGTANFTVKATDAGNSGNSATQALSITIFAGLAIGACPTPTATVGQSYGSTLSGSGGVTPYQWSLSGGQLPAGLSLDASSGQISGVPSQAGSSSFTIKLIDNGGSNVSQSCSITVVAALSIAAAGLADGSQGASYSQMLTASGGQPPYTWSLAGGALPPGITLGPAGQLTGTPTGAGTFSFTARVTDKNGVTAMADLSIRIASGLAIAGCPAATALQNQPYSSTLSGSGGQLPYNWSISGQLPAGLSLDSRSGAITGTPTQAGSTSFTVALADAASTSVTRACSIAVGQAVTITAPSLPSTTVGAAYSQQLNATGGTPPYTWSVASGSVPPGLSLSGSGQITGAATSAGNFTFTVRAADSAGASATANVTVQVAGSIAIGSCPAASAIAGQVYNGQFSASGGQPPYTWSVVSGVLPSGIRLSGNLGTLSGTPIDLGNYNYTVQAADRSGATGSVSCALSVTAGLAITTSSIADATERSAYSQTLQAVGGQTPYAWSISVGTLPPGLTLNSSAGVIAGTPAQPGVFTFTVLVTDAAGVSVQKQYAITVASGLVIPACPAATVEAGFAYASSVSAAGGTQPYAFTISGSLPPGLSFDNSASAITGTPSQPGSFPFTITVADKTGGTAKRDCTFDVRAAVRIVNDSLAAGSTGASYVATLSAAGGVPPYNWSSSAGSLPPGLFLNAGTGQISGTPAIAGNYSFTAQITDSLGAQTAKNFSIAIGQGLVISDCPSPAATIGQPYSATLTVSGGTAPYAWSLSAGTLPSGLSLRSDAAVISGTPDQPGQYNYTLRVDDAAAKSSMRACTIQVNASGLSVTTAATLPAALAGIAYTQNLGAAGGNAPYSWTVVDGALPAGLTLDASGKIAGTASTPGSYQFTVQVMDQDGATMRQTFTLAVQAGTAPTAHITGLPDIIAPAQQPSFDLQLDSAYPLAITGTITLTFVPDSDVQVDDPAIQFATGGRTINFSIPANSTKVTFAAPIAALQTGTVAGTIQLTVKMLANGADITPNPAPQRSIRVDRPAPRITSVTIVRNANGFEVRIVGFSTTRDVTQGVFRFTAANGTTIDLTVPMADSARAWFQSSASAPFGGQFSLAQPFTFQGGTAPALSSVAVTLSNGQGVSAAVTASF